MNIIYKWPTGTVLVVSDLEFISAAAIMKKNSQKEKDPKLKTTPQTTVKQYRKLYNSSSCSLWGIHPVLLEQNYYVQWRWWSWLMLVQMCTGYGLVESF